MTESDNFSLEDGIKVIREIIRRAILTFKAIPDHEARFLRDKGSWHWVRQSMSEAYGYSAASVREFQPTAYEIDQALEVLPWLAWLSEYDGRDAVKRILAWAYGVPLWRIAQKEGVSERTASRRIDRSIVQIINRVCSTTFTIEVVDEPYRSTPYAMILEKPVIKKGYDYSDGLKVAKVYVHGKGLLRNGKAVRDGMEIAERKKFV